MQKFLIFAKDIWICSWWTLKGEESQFIRSSEKLWVKALIQFFAKVQFYARKTVFQKTKDRKNIVYCSETTTRNSFCLGWTRKNWRISRALSWIWGECQSDSGTNAGNSRYFTAISCDHDLPAHDDNSLLFFKNIKITVKISDTGEN